MLRRQVLCLVILCLALASGPVAGWSAPGDLSEAGSLHEQVKQLHRAGQSRQALPLAQKALQIRYKELGPENPDVAASLTLLGLLYQDLGSLDEALPLLQRALQIRYKALGDSHPDTAASLANLGDLYRLKRSLDEAQPLLERALRLREKGQGPEHPDTAASLNSLAAFYQDKGDYAKAQTLLERAVAIRERTLSDNNPDQASSLDSLAELHRRQGAFAKALPLAEKAYRLREQVLGPLHPATAQSLNNLAAVFRDMGFYSKAQPLLAQALQIRQKTMGLEHLVTAQSLDNLGLIYLLQKDFEKSGPLLERAWLIREKSLPPEHPELAVSLANLAALRRGQGDPGAALTLLQRAREIKEKALGPEHPDTLAGLNQLAELHLDMGAPAKAIPLYERVVQAREKILGPEHLDTAASLVTLAAACERLGNYDKALAHYQRVWQIKEKALGPEHADTLASLHTLAGLYAQTGAYEKALPLYDKVLQLREKTPGPDHPDTAASLMNLARIHQGLGNTDKALDLSKRALKINETALSADHPQTAAALVQLASVYESLEAFDLAQDLYDRAVKVYDKSLGPEHLETAAALERLAGLYAARGLYDQAVPLYERSLKIYEKTGAAGRLEAARTLDRLAALQLAQGQTDKALPLLERASRAHEKALGPEHPDTSRLWLQLARLYLQAQDQDQAKEAFNRIKASPDSIEAALLRDRPEDAWKLLEDTPPPPVSSPAYQINYATQQGRALAGTDMLPQAAVAFWQAVQAAGKQPLRQPGAWLDSWPPGKSRQPYQGLVEVLVRLAAAGEPLPPELQEFGPDPKAAAFSLAEAAKAHNFLTTLARAPMSPSGLELPDELRQRQTTLNQRLAANAAQWERAVRGGKDGLQEAIATRKKLLADVDTLRAQLLLTQPLAAALYHPQPLPLSDLPLAADEVVIAYALGEKSSVVFVVRQGGVHELHQLPLGRQALTEKVRAFLAPLLHPGREPFSLENGRELYELLLAKPLAAVAASDQVIIIPDGILGALPFEALVLATGDDAATSLFVGDQRSLLYYPTAAVLAQQRGRDTKPAGRPLFALGNPNLSPPAAPKPQAGSAVQPPPPPTPAPVGYPPLQADETLIQALSQVFQVSPQPPDVLLGADASETNLRQAPLADYRTLHFATHTDFTGAAPGRLEPFLLLAQTGNRPPDDGFLTQSEVLALPLSARLVVLTHARLGRDKAITGDGVMHLVRAFQYAGAHSVLVALWEQDPHLAQEFFNNFYRNLKDGKSTGQALWLARTALRMAHPDPRFWAGFILYGEG